MDWVSLGLLGVLAWWCVVRIVGIPEWKSFRKLHWTDQLAVTIPFLVALYFLYFIFSRVRHYG